MSGITRRTLACTVLALVFALSASADTVSVVVGNNFFDPGDVQICLGDTVSWEWVGAGPAHTVTAGDGCNPNGAFPGSPLQMSGTHVHTFGSIPEECASDDSAGDNTCSYYCTPHCASGMTGIVTIGSAASADLGLSTNKLRVTRDGSGRGGTLKGVMNTRAQRSTTSSPTRWTSR